MLVYIIGAFGLIRKTNSYWPFASYQNSFSPYERNEFRGEALL